MNYFSPHCPNCERNDEVEIFYEGKLHYSKYYCKRCKQYFEAWKGYPEVTASVYQVTGGSVSWSGNFIVFSDEE